MPLGYAKYSFYNWLRYFLTIGLGDTINTFNKMLLTQNNHLIKPGYPTTKVIKPQHTYHVLLHFTKMI